MKDVAGRVVDLSWWNFRFYTLNCKGFGPSQLLPLFIKLHKSLIQTTPADRKLESKATSSWFYLSKR
ncbi:hypothetical protein HanXRQr2_Chr07g0308081 [Helianthus annuus]|uniref:Uncharacterized protein n=1 Tax=Helianthus annuus TaxID=4232 RepID=A0A251VG23_HELAN|nr:hypothetical protein HanXRQr2_Chr07g0308081 [Helianthus annuus]